MEPMEGLEPEKYDALLELPDKGFKTVVACAAGYRSGSDKYASLAKVRFKNPDVLEKI